MTIAITAEYIVAFTIDNSKKIKFFKSMVLYYQLKTK